MTTSLTIPAVLPQGWILEYESFSESDGWWKLCFSTKNYDGAGSLDFRKALQAMAEQYGYYPEPMEMEATTARLKDNNHWLITLKFCKPPMWWINISND